MNFLWHLAQTVGGGAVVVVGLVGVVAGAVWLVFQISACTADWLLAVFRLTEMFWAYASAHMPDRWEKRRWAFSETHGARWWQFSTWLRNRKTRRAKRTGKK